MEEACHVAMPFNLGSQQEVVGTESCTAAFSTNVEGIVDLGSNMGGEVTWERFGEIEESEEFEEEREESDEERDEVVWEVVGAGELLVGLGLLEADVLVLVVASGPRGAVWVFWKSVSGFVSKWPIRWSLVSM